MIFDPVFLQALEVRAPAVTPRTRPNPSPLGTIKPGGATAQLLVVLMRRPERFLSYQEIAQALLEPKSLTWALRQCQAMGWVETTEDPRSARYRRYRITALGRTVFE